MKKVLILLLLFGVFGCRSNEDVPREIFKDSLVYGKLTSAINKCFEETLKLVGYDLSFHATTEVLEFIIEEQRNSGDSYEVAVQKAFYEALNSATSRRYFLGTTNNYVSLDYDYSVNIKKYYDSFPKIEELEYTDLIKVRSDDSETVWSYAITSPELALELLITRSKTPKGYYWTFSQLQ